MAYTAIWKQLPVASATAALTRSSHGVQVYEGTAYIFGGELRPREPVPEHVLSISLDSQAISTITSSGEATSPAPRVGPTWTRHGTNVYLFGGRGGPSMQPMGTELWKWDIKSQIWEELKHTKGEAPEGRSYHAAAVLGDDLYIHAGCPATGRLTSLDKFNVLNSTWSSLASAPGPPRGGTIIAPTSLQGKSILLRFGGFGGPEFGELKDLAYYDPASNAWQTIEPRANQVWPEARSVHGLVGINGSGPEVALLFMGEGTPAPAHLGHSGAGNFLRDVWVLTYDDNAGFDWYQATCPNQDEVPQGRGWFASDGWSYEGDSWCAVISGGLNEKNQRLGDVWVLTVSRSA